MDQKLQKIFSRYRKLLTTRVKNFKTGKGAGKGNGLNIKKAIVKGNRSKERILSFYEKNGRWPSRISDSKRERSLGFRFENFVSPQAAAYDLQLRRIAMVSGRKTNNKRRHNVQQFKKDIISFIETHGRVPTTYTGEKIEGEGTLRAKLDYYTKQANDMTLLGQVYSLDKCHKSNIPARYRPIINRALGELEKPLVRLANYEINEK